MRPKHPRGVVMSLQPLMDALHHKRTVKFPEYYAAPLNLHSFWWGVRGMGKEPKDGLIHKMILTKDSYSIGSILHQLYLSDMYFDLFKFDLKSGPPRLKAANAGWFYVNFSFRNPVYLFTNYWLAYAYIRQRVGDDK